MPMTVVITRNLADRFRGFLASCMCEIAPGVYTAPRMSEAVRERVWEVLAGWYTGGEDQALVMTWPAPRLPGGQDFRVLGAPRTELAEHQGIFLGKRKLSEEELGSLKTELARQEEGERSSAAPPSPG